MASTEGTTAHKYLSGQRDWSALFTDSDLIAIVNDKHPNGGLLYVFLTIRVWCTSRLPQAKKR